MLGCDCNQPKPLSGIETQRLQQFDRLKQNHQLIAINLNPYQGLKLFVVAVIVVAVVIAINLNPYQGLKRFGSVGFVFPCVIAINLNPYQGLKPRSRQQTKVEPKENCNQPKPLSGIETF